MKFTVVTKLYYSQRINKNRLRLRFSGNMKLEIYSCYKHPGIFLRKVHEGLNIKCFKISRMKYLSVCKKWNNRQHRTVEQIGHLILSTCPLILKYKLPNK